MDYKSCLQDLPVFRQDLAWAKTSLGDVEALASFLGNFDGTIADRRWFDGDPQDAGTVIKNIIRGRPARLDGNDAESVVGLCEKLKYWAVSLDQSDTSGRGPWWLYYTTNFITELERTTGAERDAATLRTANSRPQNRGREFLEYSAKHLSNDRAGGELRVGDAGPGANGTNPSYLWFEVSGLPAFQALDPSELASWKHLLRANLLETISEATAEHLARLGFDLDLDVRELASEPPSSEPEAIAFPFFVMDFDWHSSGAYCRRSASGRHHNNCLRATALWTTALSILRRLAKIAVKEGEEQPPVQLPTPPVVAMTFRGNYVRVGTVHQNEQGNDCKKRYFWEGDMTRLRDVIELKVILSNVSTWATSVFRSWISNQVAQWRCRFPSITEEEDGEEEQMQSLVTKFAHLRVSRTNSFKTRNASGVTEMTMRETSQPCLPHAAGRISDITEVTPRETAYGQAPPKASNSEETKRPEVVMSQPIIPTMSPAILPTRSDATRSDPPRLLLAPLESRPRAASVGANLQRGAYSVSFRSSIKSSCEPRPSTYEDAPSISVSEAERPRSFHAEDFLGAKFQFGNPREQYRKSGESGDVLVVKKHIRVFSAHDFDGEKFSFSTPSPYAKLSPGE